MANNNKFDSRQSELRAAQAMLGSAANDTLDTVFPKINDEIAKLFEDRNLLLSGGGNIAVNSAGTSVTFSAALTLYINSKVSGGSPVAIDLTNTTRTFTIDGNMLYAIINRTIGTATVIADSSTLPSITNLNQEIVLIAKRVGTSIYFRNGQVFAASSTGTFADVGSVVDSTFVINDSSDLTKQIAFDAAGTTGTKTTIQGSQTTNKTITLPDANTTLLGIDNIATVSNKTLDFIRQTTANNSTAITSSTTLAVPTTGVVRLTGTNTSGNILGIAAGVSTQQVILENNTGSQIIISNNNAGASSNARIYTGTGSNIPMPDKATLVFTYDSINSKWMLTGGAGISSGSGGSKNYLTTYLNNPGNGDFELGTIAGWSLFNTTFTNGIPTGSITAGASSISTFTTISSNQLSGNYSLYTNAASLWAAGQGFISDIFTIDNEDKAKVLAFKLSYSNPDGSYLSGNFSGTSQNTFAIYIYDVTNGIWIQPAGVYGITQILGIGTATGTFQTSSNSTQYRIAVLAAGVTTGQMAMTWDSFFVGPQIITQGAIITDWQSYNMFITDSNAINVKSSSPVQNSAKWRRVGSDVEIQFAYYHSTTPGTAGTGQYHFYLPSGLITDSISENGPAGNSSRHAGTADSDIGGSGRITWAPTPVGGQNYFVLNTGIPDGATAYTTYLGSTNGGSGASYAFNQNNIAVAGTIKIPIAGWGSNVETSNSTDTRIVSARYTKSSSQTLTSNIIVNFDSLTNGYDTHNAVTTGASWKFLAPVPGFYKVNAYVGSTGTFVPMSLYKNGVQYSTSFAVFNSGPSGAPFQCNLLSTVKLAAGEYFDIRSLTVGGGGSTISLVTGDCYVEVERISGPAVIAANESVIATYTTISPLSINSTDSTIIFNVKEIDTHSSYDTITGKFTAPISGKYQFSGCIETSNFNPGAGAEVRLGILLNNIFYYKLGSQNTITSGTSVVMAADGEKILNLNAGDYVEFRIRSSNATNLTTTTGFNHIDIVRLGN